MLITATAFQNLFNLRGNTGAWPQHVDLYMYGFLIAHDVKLNKNDPLQIRPGDPKIIMSDVDSELAALLDEELFQEDAAVTNADNSDRPQDTQEEDEEQQQQPKRARREPLAAEDTDSDFSGLDDDDVEDDDEEEEEIQHRYICPPHPGWWMGLCIRCGAARRTRDAAQEGNNANNAAAAAVTTIKHLHHKQALEVGVCWSSLSRAAGAASYWCTFCYSLSIRIMSTVRHADQKCDR